MNDLEISKALALAIGWNTHDLFYFNNKLVCYTLERHPAGHKVWDYQPFDYRDWNVIGPIAAKYDCFPVIAPCHGDEWLSTFMGDSPSAFADTPQKAIALAVIQGAKK